MHITISTFSQILGGRALQTQPHWRGASRRLICPSDCIIKAPQFSSDRIQHCAVGRHIDERDGFFLSPLQQKSRSSLADRQSWRNRAAATRPGTVTLWPILEQKLPPKIAAVTNGLRRRLAVVRVVLCRDVTGCLPTRVADCYNVCRRHG